MSREGRTYKGYKAGAVHSEEYRIRAFYTRKHQEFWCPFCPASFMLESEYKEHYRKDHLEIKKHDDHVIRMEKLRKILIKKIHSRNATV